MGFGDSRSSDTHRRNRLAYLSLHYAILGEEKLSEHIRELIWQLDRESSTETTVVSSPVSA